MNYIKVKKGAYYMNGLIFHELFILGKKSKNYLIVLAISIISSLIIPIMAAKTYMEPNLFICFQGSGYNEIASYVNGNPRLKVTDDKQKSVLLIDSKIEGERISLNVSLTGDSRERSLEAKDLLGKAVDKYKSKLIKDRAKELGLSDSFLEPVTIKFEDSNQIRKQELLSSILIPALLLLLMPFAVFILFETGLIEERKSKSFYTLLLSDVHPAKKILVFFLFRVFLPTFVVFIISLILIGAFLGSFFTAFKICFLMLLNIAFIYYILLLLSLVLRSPNQIYYVWIFMLGIMMAGWWLGKSIFLKLLPFTTGITVTRMLAYGDNPGLWFPAAVIIYFVLFGVLTNIGVRLFKNEVMLRVEVL